MSVRFPTPFLLLAATLMLFVNTPSHAEYRVQGKQILHNGEPIQLRGVNWFGFETELHTVHGLWQRNWREMIEQMHSLKINAVRVPFCPTTLRAVTPGGIDYDKNPELRGLDSLDILDKVVTALDERGMHVLLDHHRPDCKAISELWYTDDYSEQQWIDDLVYVAKRYQGLSHFMGLDLKNEPHGEATWGAGEPKTDWNKAAERAAAAVLEAAPDTLVWVEGIQDTGRCSETAPAAWWGGNLAPMRCEPLDIPADRLVLSPHVYGPDVHPQPYFDVPDFPDNLPAIWEAHFGQLVDDGFAIVPGEFGGRYGHAGDVRDRVWQNALVEYLRKKNITSGFYWSWNPNSGDTGGLLENDWQTTWPTKLALLNRLWFGTQLASVPATPVEQAAPERADRDTEIRVRDVAETPGLRYAVTTMSDWGAGYCVDVAVRNTGSRPLQWQFSMPVEGRIRNLWNAFHESSGNKIAVRGVDWNQRLEAGAETHFGFCAKRQAPATDGPLAATAGDQSLEAQINIQSQWQNGYCADVTVRNPGQREIDWRITLDIKGRVNNLWRGDFEQRGTQITVSGKDYNKTIPPGGTEHFGFCADL